MKEEKKDTVFGCGLIWFGAAVSIAEILTGSLFAPLGFGKGLAAIVLGHAIGGALMFLAGLVSAKSSLSAMESVKGCFGTRGGLLFAVFNVLQLVGWTAVMIASCGQSAASVCPLDASVWCAITAVLILAWLWAGVGILQKINVAAIALLFGLSLLLSRFAFQGTPQAQTTTLGFGAALELSIAMPISWLPLIGDYTCNARKPTHACLAGVLVYSLVSCWMYAIGMGAAITTGHSEIGAILSQANLGLAALLIIILSTVTTTFLDVHSAGLSAASIWKRLPPRLSATITCLLGLLLALLANTGAFESFLYWIGSVFVPMATVQIMDVFVLRRPPSRRPFEPVTLALWGLGFVLYRLALSLDLPCGSTIPAVAATAALCLAACPSSLRS